MLSPPPHCFNRTPPIGGKLPARPPLDPSRWDLAVSIFERALEVAPGARDAFIRAEAKGDEHLAATVRDMLDADSGADSMLDDGINELAHLALTRGEVDARAMSPGEKIGDFEIIAEIGRGGMGIVYAARDATLGRVAALKLLPAREKIDTAARDRLMAEAQAASALDHPNVATIYQVGETQDGQRFIAMARYEGETLRERLSRGPLSPRDAFDIAAQVASGLAAAHAAGLVHRDVKPENIFITKPGLVKLLDFGIATLAGSPREGPTTRGTILYMSPEHARREPADERSDVWSLGVVLYEMLAGETPFKGGNAADVLARIADPAPVALPPSIRRLPAVAIAPIVRALDKNRQKRFADASGMSAELQKAMRHWTRSRSRTVAAVAGVAAVALLAALANATRSDFPLLATPELAVLPVTGGSSDSAASSLASALSDEIAARLVALGRVKLVRAPVDSLGDVVPKSGLHMLRLDIERNATGPQVMVSLIDGKSTGTIWSDRRSFDRSRLRELGRDVVVGVLGALGRPVTERERGIIGSGFPSNAEAYAEFLEANRYLALRTPPAVESALVHYRRAAQLDSTFAGAFARQSYAYSVLIDWGWKPSRLLPADPLTEGLALAERATRLDSTSAEAWLARAYLLVQRDPRRYAGAVEAFQYAIALDPYNAEAFHQYGQTLTSLGRYTEAMAAYRRALDLEPDRAMSLVPMAAIHKRQGRLDEGLRLLDSAISAAPRVPYALAARSMARSHTGQIEGARKDAEVALTLDSAYRIPPLTALARALWMAGDTAQARKRLDEAFRSIANPPVPSPTEAYWIATAEVVTGRTSRAIRLLRLAEPKGAWLWFYFQGPELDDFRRIPEVAAVMDDVDPRRTSSPGERH